jgi:hypothetical protein
VAGDDEQRVVDADPEAHHRRDGRGGGGDVHQPGEQHHAGGAGDQPTDGDGDRQPGRDDRAEREHQQREGDQDADQLAAALDLGRGAGELAAQLDLVADVLGGRGGLLERVDDPVEVGVGGRDVVPDVEQGGGAVLGQPRRHGGDVLGALQPGGDLVDDGGVEAAVVVDDDLGTGAAGVREVLPELVDAVLGAGVGDVPVVPELAAEGGGQAAERHEHEEPGRDRAPGVSRRRQPYAVQGIHQVLLDRWIVRPTVGEAPWVALECDLSEIET